MKKVLCMAALALAAMSCSDNANEIPQPGPTPANAQAIQIGQTIKGLTKAAIVNGSNVTATVLMCDAASNNWVNFVPREKNILNASNAFENDNDRANVSAATFVAGTTNEVGMNPPLYYAPKDASKVPHLVAVAPAGRVDGQTIVFSVTDGLQDVMYAAEQTAGTSSSAQPVKFTFEHVTTQISFAIQLQPAASNGEWTGKTVTVKDITIHEAKLPASITYNGGAVNWGMPTLLSVPGLNNATLTQTAATVGTPVMIAPATGLAIDVKIGVGGEPDMLYNDVQVLGTSGAALATVAGEAHTVTLTVEEPTKVSGATPITATATVTPWKAGDAGSATLK